MNPTIDSFVDIPILVTAAAGLVLFALLLISKIRNTSRVSFVFYLAIGISTAGLLYTYMNQKLAYLVFTLFALEFLLLVYAFVLAVSDPQKKKERKAQQEKDENKNPDAIDAETLSLIKQEFENRLGVSKEITTKTASFFNSEDAQGSFYAFLSKYCMEKTESDGCAILQYDEFDNILAVKSLSGTFPPPYKLPDDLPHKPIRVETNFKFSQFALKGNCFGDVFTDGKAVNIAEPKKSRYVVQNGPEDFLKCGPYMFIPVSQSGENVALICLSRKPEREPFSEELFKEAISLSEAISTALVPLKSFLSYAEHTELTKEGDIATKFQKTLFPKRLPVINNMSIGKYSLATENVCGDYYDIIPYRKDRITFVMADVAGKGMNSLVIMIMIRAMLRLIANTNQSSATLLEWVNKAICSESNSMDHFASVSLINYNSTDNTAQIATCGTNPVLLYSVSEGNVKKLSVDCEPLGVEKSTSYKDIDISLNTGDILVTCTDGILECLNENGVQYSLDSLEKVIKDNCKLSGKDIANKIKDNVKKFCGTTQQYDDQSLLVVKIQG